MGVKTVQAYRGDALLRGFDADVREMAGVHQKLIGVDTRFGLSPTEIKETKGGYIVSFDDGTKIGTDLVFMATGRKAHTPGLGLENAGVDVDKNGAVIVDEFSQSSTKNIYAVGDVTDRVNLTPVAIREGAAFIDTVYNDSPTAYDHTCLLYTSPSPRDRTRSRMPSSA